MKYFGYAPSHLKYMLEEQDSRLKAIETFMSDQMPIVGAGLARTEGLVNTMADHFKADSNLFLDTVNKNTESVISNSKKNNKTFKRLS